MTYVLGRGWKEKDLIELLKALEALQSVDAELGELTRSSSEYPSRLTELEEEVGAARQTRDEGRQKVTDLESQKQALEEQLAADREKVKKWEARLTEQRSPREYTALAREIDIAKKQNTTMTGDIAELAKEIAASQEALDTIEEEVAEVERVVRNERRRIRHALNQIEKQEEELTERRNDAAKHVPTQMLRRYDQIQKRRGLAVVQVQGGTCSGCRMSIPPQLYNQLVTRARLDSCPSCARMIYVPEAFAKEAPEEEVTQEA